MKKYSAFPAAAAISPAMTILLQLAPFIAKEELVKEDCYQYVYQHAGKKLKPLIRNGKVNAPDQLLPYRMELLLKQLQKDQITR